MTIMVSPAEEGCNVPMPIVVGCTRKVAERLVKMPTNETLYLPALSLSSHGARTNTSSNINPFSINENVYETLYLPTLPLSSHGAAINTSSSIDPFPINDIVYFALPTQPLQANHGYIFSRNESQADFQLPNEAPPLSSLNEFRITINQQLEWTLVDESVTGITVNNTRLYSADYQRMVACTGFQLAEPTSELPLLTNKPNTVEIGWGGLQFQIHITGNAADYYHHLFTPRPSRSDPALSTSVPFFSPNPIASETLSAKDDIDTEVHRQTGGDLSKGVCVDTALFRNAGGQGKRGGGGGGEMMEVDERDWSALAGFGRLSLGAEEGGGEAMED